MDVLVKQSSVQVFLKFPLHQDLIAELLHLPYPYICIPFPLEVMKTMSLFITELEIKCICVKLKVLIGVKGHFDNGKIEGKSICVRYW